MSKNQRGVARPVRPATPTTLRARHPMLTALVPLAAVVVALATMVVVKVSGGNASALSSPPLHPQGTSASSTDGATALPAGVVANVTAAGTAALAESDLERGLVAPTGVSGHPTLLRGTDGKPEILYVGAEYCPFCAAERWALVEALSHFGTFTGLQATHSSTSDGDPDTKTFSFVGSSYASPYVDFVPVELYSNQPEGSGYAPLQTLSAAESRVLDTYDQAPYTSVPGGIPFISLADRAVVSGAGYDPTLLAGLSMTAIAAQLEDPSSPVARAVNGTADEITAAICSLTGGQPASVCQSPAVEAAGKAGA